jgi:hypothetical protein
MEIARHVSSDGILKIIVLRDNDGLTVGFEDSDSHTHGDVLIGEYAVIGQDLASPEEAVHRYVSDILANRIKVKIYRRNGEIFDIVAFPYEVKDDAKYLSQEESMEVRYWNQQ